MALFTVLEKHNILKIEMFKNCFAVWYGITESPAARTAGMVTESPAARTAGMVTESPAARTAGLVIESPAARTAGMVT